MPTGLVPYYIEPALVDPFELRRFWTLRRRALVFDTFFK